MDFNLSHDIPITPTTTPAIVSREPFCGGPSTSFEVGGSSAPPGFSPPRIDPDDASVRLAMHLAQNESVYPSSRGKGISFEEGHQGADKPSVDELQKKISVLDQKNIELDIQVNELLNENAKLKSQVSDLQDDRAIKTKKISDL